MQLVGKGIPVPDDTDPFPAQPFKNAQVFCWPVPQRQISFQSHACQHNGIYAVCFILLIQAPGILFSFGRLDNTQLKAQVTQKISCLFMVNTGSFHINMQINRLVTFLFNPLPEFQQPFIVVLKLACRHYFYLQILRINSETTVHLFHRYVNTHTLLKNRFCVHRNVFNGLILISRELLSHRPSSCTTQARSLYHGLKYYPDSWIKNTAEAGSCISIFHSPWN